MTEQSSGITKVNGAQIYRESYTLSKQFWSVYEVNSVYDIIMHGTIVITI